MSGQTFRLMNEETTPVHPDELLDAEISLFSSCQSPHPKKSDKLTLRGFFDKIQRGIWADKVAKVREANRDSICDANRFKKKLPLVKPSGVFNGRKESDFVSHSRVLCLDIDDVGAEMPTLRKNLAADDHVLAFFLSPRGTGLKVFVPIEATNPVEHKQCGRAAFEYFSTFFAGVKLDKAPSNVSSNCFVSYDPDLWVSNKHRLSFQPVSSSSNTPTPTLISEYSEHSISHPPLVLDKCIVRNEAEQRLEKAPKAIRNVFERYLQSRAVHRGQRHYFLTQVIPPLFTVLGRSEIKELLLLHYDLFCGTWSSSREHHEEEIDLMLHSWPQKYLDQMTIKTRVFYLAMPTENHRAAFRICCDLATKTGSFYLSGAELGKRLGIHCQQAHRILKGFAADGIIQATKHGHIWAAGSRPLATCWKWKLDLQIKERENTIIQITDHCPALKVENPPLF
jgi:hypothetical protein